MALETTTFNQNIRGAGCIDDFGLAFAISKWGTTLAADVAQSVTVPSFGAVGATVGANNKYAAIIRAQEGKTIFVSNTGTATLPGGAFAETNSEPVGKKTCRYVTAGSTLSFITHDTGGGYVWVGFYAVNQ
jgi:hypothetical protein